MLSSSPDVELGSSRLACQDTIVGTLDEVVPQEALGVGVVGGCLEVLFGVMRSGTDTMNRKRDECSSLDSALSASSLRCFIASSSSPGLF